MRRQKLENVVMTAKLKGKEKGEKDQEKNVSVEWPWHGKREAFESMGCTEGSHKTEKLEC